MKQKYRNISIATLYIWIGFVCAISFMESWLKFQAPGIDTKLGLGIGQLVFSALNKIEIVCAIIIVTTMLLLKHKNKNYLPPISFSLVLAILAIQSLWLLPYLNVRASQIINGFKVPDSYMHLLFVILEIIKIICLNLFGIKLFRESIAFKKNHQEIDNIKENSKTL